MTLFSSTDADLPLLSHVYQIDTSTTEEVYLFCQTRYHVLYEADDLRLSLEMCDFAKKIMRELFNREGLSRVNVHNLRVRGEQIQRYRSLHVSGSDEKDFFTAADLNVVENSHGNRLVMEIFDSLTFIIEMLGKGTRLLRECEECGNIFVRRPRSPEQRFCSHRCATANGQRRRRQWMTANSACLIGAISLGIPFNYLRAAFHARHLEFPQEKTMFFLYVVSILSGLACCVLCTMVRHDESFPDLRQIKKRIWKLLHYKSC